VPPLSPCQAVAQPAPPARSPFFGPARHSYAAGPRRPRINLPWPNQACKPRGPSWPASARPTNPRAAHAQLPDPAAAAHSACFRARPDSAPSSMPLNAGRVSPPAHGRRGWTEPPEALSRSPYKHRSSRHPLQSQQPPHPILLFLSRDKPRPTTMATPPAPMVLPTISQPRSPALSSPSIVSRPNRTTPSTSSLRPPRARGPPYDVDVPG